MIKLLSLISFIAANPTMAQTPSVSPSTTANQVSESPAPSVPTTPVVAPTAPTIATPTVTTPSVPAPLSPTKAPIAPPASSVATAALVAPAYNEAAFKKASDAGLAILLIFARHGDPIWDKQAAVLPVVLRETEFGRIAQFQIDISNAELVERFAVKSAGTLLLMKDGFERLRSTRMTKPDVIRKMLRMNTLL